MRALAVTPIRRTAVFPDLATIDELGLKGFDATTWHGLVAPAKTPRDIVVRLHRATVEALNDPAVRKSLTDLGVDIVGNTPEEFAAYIKAEIPKGPRSCGPPAPSWIEAAMASAELVSSARKRIRGAMMRIDPSETVLTGRWLSGNQGGLVADETCKRIDVLVRDHLKELGRDPSGWDALYRDPDDERLWELTYPQSERHGEAHHSFSTCQFRRHFKNTDMRQMSSTAQRAARILEMTTENEELKA